MNLGNEIVGALVSGGDITLLLDAGFNTSWLSTIGASVIFPNPSSDRDAFSFILRHYSRHRVTPSDVIFRMEFPEKSYKIPESPVSIPELLDLVTSRVKSYLTADLIAQAIDLHDDGKVDDALQVLSSGVSSITSSVTLKDTATNIASPDYDVEQLLSVTMEEGVPFGIGPIDDVFFGFQSGQLITLIGRQKSGKTLSTVNSAYNAWLKGYSVLFFSVEMSTKLIKERFYSFGSHVSLSRMRRGTLRDPEKGRVRDFHKQISSKDWDVARFIVSEKKSMITLDDIEAEVRKHRPHIVYIDGFSFMVDRKTGRLTDDWQANENVAAELKSFAMENQLVVFVNTQAQEKQYSSSKGIEGRLIQGGTGLLKASDLILGCNKDNDVIIFTNVMSRFEEVPTVYVTVDWEHTEFQIMQAPSLEEKGI